MTIKNLCKTVGLIFLAGSMTSLFSIDDSTYYAALKNWKVLENGSHDLEAFTVDKGTVWGASNVALWNMANDFRWDFTSQLNFGYQYDSVSFIPGRIFNMYPGNPRPFIHATQYCPDCWTNTLYGFNGSTWEGHFDIGGRYSSSGYYRVADSNFYHIYMSGVYDDSPKEYFVHKYNLYKDSIFDRDGTIFSEKSNCTVEFLEINNNTPYMGYRPHESDSFKIMKFNGSTWQTLGKAGFINNISGCNIAFDNANTPNILVRKEDSSGSTITMMRFNGTDWEQVGKPVFIDSKVSDLHFEFVSGSPVIAFVKADTTYAVKKFIDSTWKNICAFEPIIDGPRGIGTQVWDNALYLSYQQKSDNRMIISRYKVEGTTKTTTYSTMQRTLNFSAKVINNVLHISGVDATAHQISLINLQGQQIKMQKITDGTYKISEKLKTGLYLTAIDGKIVPLNHISH